MMKWVNVELNREDAVLFRGYLVENLVKFETSGAGSYTHFECLMTSEQVERANDYLESI